MNCAVIDISSSGVSLIVASVRDEKSGDAEIIFRDRIFMSLFYYAENGSISDRGTDRLVDALNTAKRICAGMDVDRCYVISTGSLRNTVNYEGVDAEVEKRTGFTINRLSGETEAYCDYVANTGYSMLERPVLVDIGGKSIEICDLASGNRDDMHCLDFGLYDIRDGFIESENPDEDEAENIKKFVRERFNGEGVPKSGSYRTVLLSGSTSRAVYDVYCEYTKKSSAAGTMMMDRREFKKMTNFLITNDARSRLLFSAAPAKVGLIIPAAIVIRHIYKRFDVQNVIVSDRGVKEGYLSLVLQGKQDGVWSDVRAAGPADTDTRPARAVVADDTGSPDGSAEETEETEDIIISASPDGKEDGD